MGTRAGIAAFGGLLMLALTCMPCAEAQMIPIPNGSNFDAWYTIATAASENKTDDVKAKLIAGENPNTNDVKGATPLIYAAQFGNAEMAKLLLQWDARVDDRDAFGNTALHWAAQRGSIETVRLLLDAKAAIDAQNRQGVTPLMLAASRNQTPVVRLLIHKGADPARQDYTGRDASGWGAGKPAVLQALRETKPG